MESERGIAEPRNPRLLEAMRLAAERGDRGGLVAVLQLLRDSPLVVPTLHDPSSGEPRHRAIQTADGPVFLAFTDLDALRAWDPEVREWAVMTGRDLAAAALEWDAARVTVNAAGPDPGDVQPGDLAWVASGEPPPGAPGGAPPPDPAGLQLRAPSAEPDPALVEALRAGLEGIGAVRELYLAEDGRTGTPVVGMLVEPRSEAAAAAAVLAELVRPHVPPGEPLDLVVLDDARRAELAELVDPIA
jgi:SseB protein N-terminal domain/SseB protein C-terminal domain